jgi:hypothetical protein
MGFVHFSHIRGMSEYRYLIPDEAVEILYAGDYPHDGCQWTGALARAMER